MLKDAAIQGDSFVCGANEPDAHLRGVAPGATSTARRSTSARSRPATARRRHPIEIEPAIEVGNIFKLGTRYSEPLGANYLDESGAERPIVMGSYGIGPARIVAAAIEQRADERGIVWPRSIAPWQVHLVSLARPGNPSARPPTGSTRSCAASGSRSSTTTATPGRGEKLTDAELLGCPLRIVVGRGRSPRARSRPRPVARRREHAAVDRRRRRRGAALLEG